MNLGSLVNLITEGWYDSENAIAYCVYIEEKIIRNMSLNIKMVLIIIK